MRIAAIDCGTNSIHMIVVRIRPDLSFEVIDREKDMVRLGSGGLDGKALTAEAMAAALQAFSRFLRLAESHQVEEILAAATSAVREAENGGEFLAAVERETGIKPQVISGTEEARLIHLAAVYGVDVAAASAVVVDIGGGSVEITHGAGTTLRAAKSFKLGVIRLTERFVHTDPLSRRDERKLVRHIHDQLSKHLRDIKGAGFDRVIGTSGTILSLGTVASAERRRESDEIRNLRVPAKQIHRLRKELTNRSIGERMKLPGLDPRRADLIVSGAVLLDTVLRRLEAPEITLCDFALREGLVLDYIQRNRRHIAQAGQYPDIRRRSVIELAERCSYWPEHANQVARLSLSIFDQTRSSHVLTDREREWLEFAALLHDVGTHISYPRHHKHSYYLIKNGDLRGFEPAEAEIIALVARYHRKSAPKKSHSGFIGLGTKKQKAVRTLAAILRFAETLDRSHSQAVTGVEMHDRGDEYLVKLRTTGDAELELWAAHRQIEPLEHALGKSIRLSAGRASYAEQSEYAARIPGEAVRGRRHRRVGKDDAAGIAGQVAERRRPARVRDRVELVGPREGRDENGEKKNSLTPTTFSLLHATDFADRLLYNIVPPLKAGTIVIADRYAYTAFARDVARGVDRAWVRDLYSFAVRPDLSLYFRVPIDVSLDRLMARRVKLKFYEAGMDMGWSLNAQESFRVFQGKVLEEYDRLVSEFSLSVIDASLAITDQQQIVRNLVSRQLEKPQLEAVNL